MRRSRSTATASVIQPAVRCAIYTRKSTAAGLDGNFTSLDNQRGRAEAYALGSAAAFSADGRELRTVALAGERGKPGLVLETLTDLDRQPAAARRALTEVESTPGSRVLELRETNGDWQLVTRSGVWPLQR